MSTTIDQRVVEMQFDNRNFEKNVHTTMSTLDKLKQKLHLPGSAKGLEEVSAAAKKVDMRPLGKAVEDVRVRFSALQVMGVTALTNITNQAVNAGKRMMSALTIDPVKTGFNEYETKINSIQTIMSNTASKGTTMADVTRVIDELNTYADKTIYNFAEMTRNIGTFTAAGVGLEESAAAIQGIANLAAASGSSSQQASTAMYQLSQALAAGTVKLMDWNSVVNAGMGGEKFQNALKDTAREMGISVDSMIEKHGSFRESLTEGWITADVLNTTLRKFTKEGAKEYAESMVASGKYTKEQADALLKEAQNMEDAATKVKTFTQLWDTLKESAQSGWGKTWELIFGDFEEARDLFSSLSKFLGGFIDKMSDARNFVVEGVMSFSKPWKSISDKLKNSPFAKIEEGAKSVGKTIGKAADKLEYFQDIVNKVWRGDYKNSDTGRYELLDADGYDHRVVQDLVNKGYQYELTVEDIEASHKKFGLTMEKTEEQTKEATKTLDNTTEALMNLSDEELKNIGLTEDEIRLYRDLAKESKRTGRSMEELIESMSKTDGRTLLINSFKNVGNSLVGIFTAIKNAWREIFPPVSIARIYTAIESFNKFTEKLVLTDESANNLKRTFKGIFAIVDILATILGGGFKIAFKIVREILGAFNLDILDVTAYIGDVLVRFRDWTDSCLDFGKIFKKIIPFFSNAAKGVKNWISELRNSENLPVDIAKGVWNGLQYVWDGILSLFSFIGKKLWNLVEKTFAFFGIDLGPFVSQVKELAIGFRDWFASLKGSKEMTDFISWIKGSVSTFTKWIGSLKESENIPRDIIRGLANGFGDGISIVWEAARKLITSIIDGVKDLLGIHSPSTVFLAIGGFIIAGLIAGLTGGEGTLMENIKGIFDTIIGYIQGIDWGTLFAGALSVGVIWILLKLTKAVTSLLGPLDGINGILEASAGVVKKFGGLVSSFKWAVIAWAVKELAISIAILAGSLIVLSWCDTDKLWSAFGVLSALAGVLAGLIAVVGGVAIMLAKLGKGEKDALGLNDLSKMLLGVAASFLILAIAIGIMSLISEEGLKTAATIIVLFTAVVGALMVLTDKYGAKDLANVKNLISGLSTALLLLAVAIGIMGWLEWGAIGKAGAIIAGLTVITGVLMKISQKCGVKKLRQVKELMMGIGTAFLLLGVAVRVIDGVSWEGLGKAGAIAGGILAMVAILALITKIPGMNIDEIGNVLKGIGIAMILLAVTMKIVGGMSLGELGIGLLAVAALATIIGILTKTISKDLKGPEGAKSIALTLIAMSAAIAILAGVAVLLGFVNPEKLAVGIIAVGVLAVIMKELVKATGQAQSCMKEIIALTVAIAVMAAAVALLSMIDWTRLAPAVAGLGVLMYMFERLIKASGKAGGSMGGLIVLTAMVAVLGGILYLVGQLPWQNALAAAAALAIVLYTLVGSLTVLDRVKSVSANAMIAMGVLTAVLIGVAFALNIVSTLPADAAMPIAGALAIVLVTLTGVCAAMSMIPVSGAISGALGLAAFIGIMAAVLAALGGLAQIPGLLEIVQDGGELLGAIGYAIGNFIGSIIGGIGAGLSSGLPEIGANLSAFMINAMPFIVGIKMVDASMLEGVGVLAGAIIALTAADLLSSIASFISGGSNLAQLGSDLSAFMLNATPFITQAMLIKPEMMQGVRALADTILILTAADILSGLTSWLTGGSSLASFADELPILGSGLAGFAESLGTFSGDQLTTVNCAAAAVKTLAQASAEIPNTGGLLGELVGENDLGNFAAQFPVLGKGIRDFLSNIGVFTADEQSTVTAAAQAVKALAEAADTIPNAGGILADMIGDNELSTFAVQFPILGKGIRDFLTNIGAFTEDEQGTVVAAAEAIKVLAEAADTIPNEGGIWAKIAGDNSLGTFATYFPKLGTGIRGLLDEMETLTPEEQTTIGAAAEAIKVLAEAANNIPNEGGWWSKIAGDSNIGDFAANFPSVGKGIRGFVDGLGGAFTPDEVTAVDCAVRAIRAIATLSNEDLEVEDNLEEFAENIKGVGSGLAAFVKKISDAGYASINNAIGAVNRTIDMLNGLIAVDSTCADGFQVAVDNLANVSIDGLVSKFTSEGSKSIVKAAGSIFITNAIEGMESKRENIKKKAKSLADSAQDAIKNDKIYNKFKEAGKYVVKGFAAGITAETWRAEAKAEAMAEAAAKAAEEALKINSPSKVFRNIGYSIPEGLALGISKMSGMVTSSTESMADRAIGNTQGIIGRLADAISGDMDLQPTIRPVLDLAEVQARAKALDGMLNVRASAGVIANVRAIDSRMNQRRQNGNNSEVVSAIKGLRKDLGNVGNTTYSINGITYSNGDEVADAVSTIVRAARIGRRT